MFVKIFEKKNLLLLLLGVMYINLFKCNINYVVLLEEDLGYIVFIVE